MAKLIINSFKQNKETSFPIINIFQNGGNINYQEVPHNNLPEVVVEPPVWYKNYRDRLPKKVHENIRDYLTSEYGDNPKRYDEILHRLEDILSISRATVTDETNVGNTIKRVAKSLGIPFHAAYNNPEWNSMLNKVYNVLPSKDDTYFFKGKYAPSEGEQTFNALVSELAHPIQEKYGKDDKYTLPIFSGYKEQYNTPGYLEYETHKVIQPKLFKYIYYGKTLGDTSDDNLMDSILRNEGLYKPQLIHNTLTLNNVKRYLEKVWQKEDGNILDLIKEVNNNIDTFKKNHPDLYKRINEQEKKRFKKEDDTE